VECSKHAKMSTLIKNSNCRSFITALLANGLLVYMYYNVQQNKSDVLENITLVLRAPCFGYEKMAILD